jgi:hypothetical protein
MNRLGESLIEPTVHKNAELSAFEIERIPLSDVVRDEAVGHAEPREER